VSSSQPDHPYRTVRICDRADVILGASFGLDGGWRTIFGIGRIFR
jgi:hypothetical protein